MAYLSKYPFHYLGRRHHSHHDHHYPSLTITTTKTHCTKPPKHTTTATVATRQIQEDMFWFGRPQLLLTVIQTMQFVLAVMVSALIW